MVKIEPGREPATPRDAATVVLLRDVHGTSSGFEVFMVRRHGKSGFMGGAFVFPGGKLDDADSDEEVIARVRGRNTDEAAGALGEPDLAARASGLFVAAIRETFEEAGVLLADRDATSALAPARENLAQGASFARILDDLEAHLRLDLIVPWTRWITPEVEPRRYDTRFFLAVAPADQEAVRDDHETTDAAWMTPTRALERNLAGEIQLPPPTMRSLEMLEGFDRAADALAEAGSRPPPVIQPVFRDVEGTFTLALPGDPDHPVAERRIPGATRFVLSEGRWWSGEPPVSGSA